MEIMVSAWSSQIDCIAAFLWVDSEWIPQPSARGLYYVLTLDNAKYRIESNSFLQLPAKPNPRQEAFYLKKKNIVSIYPTLTPPPAHQPEEGGSAGLASAGEAGGAWPGG